MSKNIIAHEYASYERGESGTIVRSGCTLVLDSQATRRYHAHETLQGWPEPEVYWTSPTGIAFGIAPMSDSARRAIARVKRVGSA